MKRLVLAALAIWLLAAPVAAADDSQEAWAALVNGSHVVLIRHGNAPPGYGDPPGFKIDDCTTQRNLDEKGRAQARALGEAFRQLLSDAAAAHVPSTGPSTISRAVSSTVCAPTRSSPRPGAGGVARRVEADVGQLARTGRMMLHVAVESPSDRVVRWAVTRRMDLKRGHTG